MNAWFEQEGWITWAVVIVGAVLALAGRWHHRRVVVSLTQRLRQSEQWRQAELERARQTRAQVAQLTQLLADLQQRLPSAAQSRSRREALDLSVPDAVDSGPGALPAHGFADTLPLQR